MTRHADQRLVLTLASFTEDRTPEEMRAMINMALQLDQEAGTFDRHNRHLAPPELTDLVVRTYDPSEGRRVELTGVQRKTLTKLKEKWIRCERCNVPMGAHYADDKCPRPGDWPIP